MNARTAKRPESAEFEMFWRAYPRKVKRADAVKAWRQVSGDESATEILVGLEAWKRSRQWTRSLTEDRGAFVPYPATWLRARQWQDEPEPAAGPPELRPVAKPREQPESLEARIARLEQELGRKPWYFEVWTDWTDIWPSSGGDAIFELERKGITGREAQLEKLRLWRKQLEYRGDGGDPGRTDEDLATIVPPSIARIDETIAEILQHGEITPERIAAQHEKYRPATEAARARRAKILETWGKWGSIGSGKSRAEQLDELYEAEARGEFLGHARFADPGSDGGETGH